MWSPQAQAIIPGMRKKKQFLQTDQVQANAAARNLVGDKLREQDRKTQQNQFQQTQALDKQRYGLEQQRFAETMRNNKAQEAMNRYNMYLTGATTAANLASNAGTYWNQAKSGWNAAKSGVNTVSKWVGGKG